MKLLRMILGIRSDFERLFFVNEYKALAGEKKKIIVALILILFLTLMALGYAVGSIQNLKKKMDNPFTNWVDIPITNEIADRVGEIQDDYSKQVMKDSLFIEDIRGSVRFNLEFLGQNFNPSLGVESPSKKSNPWGRVMDSDDPLYSVILSPKNYIWIDSSLNLTREEGLQNCEILVTKDLMERLGFDPENPEVGNLFINDRNIETGKFEPIPVRIAGVIKELPRKCEFICAPSLYNIISYKYDNGYHCKSLISRMDNENIYHVIAKNDLDVDKTKALLQSNLKLSTRPDIFSREDVKSSTNTWQVYDVIFDREEKPSLTDFYKILPILRNSNVGLGEISRIQCESDHCYSLDPNNYYYLAFNFKKLDHIRKFKENIKERHGVEIDMSMIEAKENFALVSRLTQTISIILLVFGILSIVLFVNSLLRSHLLKVRSNLGTFKAFGLSNRFLIWTYQKIILSFLLLSILISFCGTILIDVVEQSIMKEESQFNIFSAWIGYSMLGLVLVSLLIFSRTIKKILGDTPGNLIYER